MSGGRRSGIAVAVAVVLTVLLGAPARAAGSTRVEAESYAAQHGTWVAPAPGPAGGLVVAGLSPGDWLRFDGVTTAKVRHTLVCFISEAPQGTENAVLQLRLDNPWTAPVLTIPVRTNLGGGIKQWAGAGGLPDGTHTIYLTVRPGSGSGPFAIDYLLLTEYPPPPSLNCG